MDKGGEDGRRGRGGVAWTGKGGQGEAGVGKEKECMLGHRAPYRVAWVGVPCSILGCCHPPKGWEQLQPLLSHPRPPQMEQPFVNSRDQ